MPPARFRYSNRRPLRRQSAVDQGAGGDAGSGAQFHRASNCSREALKPSARSSTLIVAGGEGVDAAAKCDKTLRFVRAIAKRGVRVASVCSGAYMLAEAGLLDGRRATTHWGRTRPLSLGPSRVKWEPDQIFVATATSGVRRDHRRHRSGAGDGGRRFRDEVAQKDRAPARALSPPQRRPVAVLLAIGIEGAERALRTAFDWAREHLDAPLTVEDLAEQAA